MLDQLSGPSRVDVLIHQEHESCDYLLRLDSGQWSLY